MLTAVKSIDVLVEGVLDNGLEFIGDYLESTVQREISIADHYGNILFPDRKTSRHDQNALLLDIPEFTDCQELLYCEDTGILFYRIEVSNQNTYVSVKNLSRDIVPRVAALLKNCRLAFKCYFSKLYNGRNSFENQLGDYLCDSIETDINEILRLNDNALDTSKHYFVLLLTAEDETTVKNTAAINVYVREYMQREIPRVISLNLGNRWAFLIPAGGADDHRDKNFTGKCLDMKAFQASVDAKFQISSRLGVGRIYGLADLRRSFNEARIAIVLDDLTGYDDKVSRFEDLGVYQPIFSQETEAIYQYCDKTLGQLIEHDRKNDGELLPTLRKLLDACGNIKATADQLFIHVNTLYYRINKIEQILNVDISKMHTRAELYTAIKVWDTMLALNQSKAMDAIKPIKLAVHA
ncbi:MAG TPA: helix-turn-helix domain-containing protein [Syntrophomonas sp.]|nr:helix-turn-helix domain-containing protein [Syntrophomonas sp.]